MFLSRLRQTYARYMSTSAEFTTRILKCDPSSITFAPNSDEPQISCPDTLAALKTAAHHLVDRREPVVFPTETVYGLGALALDANAAAKIFATKGRPADNPLIVHVSSFAMLRALLPPDYAIPPSYEALIAAFWPGPLTLLFPRHAGVVPPIITAGQATVAIRMPAHPVARALIAVAGAPLAAPSANTSGKPSPTRAAHVARDLAGRVPLILDGGACGVGLESTVVDGLHADGHLRVLRPGGVTVEDLERAVRAGMGEGSVPRVLVHRRDYADEAQEHAPTTPGMKYRHYSPAVPVVLLCTLPARPGACGGAPTAFREYVESLKADRAAPVKIGVLAPTESKVWDAIAGVEGVEWHRFPLGSVADPAAIAHNLFDGLLSLETAGVQMMLIEEVEEDREGLAIMNRVRKAASEAVQIEYRDPI